MNREELIEKVRNELSEKRFTHVMGVVDTAMELCEIYHGLEDNVFIAALLHDITKEKDVEWQIETLKKMGIEDEQIISTPKLHHAATGAYVAGNYWYMRNGDILKAILHHTTGHAHFALTGKIIYVADFCEPNRNYPEAREYLEIAKTNIDEAILKIAEFKVKKLEEKGLKPHWRTIKMINQYKK